MGGAGVFAFKHWGGGFARRGIADILGCLPNGLMLAIEVKRPGGKATREQLAFLEDVARCGGLAFIAHGVDAVEAELQALGITPEQKGLFEHR